MKRTCRGNNFREAAQKENELNGVKSAKRKFVRSGDLLA